MSEPHDLTPEERMERFCRALVDGATLVLHPDTWEEFKAALAAGRLLAVLPMAVHEIPVIPSRWMTPGDMLAFKPAVCTSRHRSRSRSPRRGD